MKLSFLTMQSEIVWPLIRWRTLHSHCKCKCGPSMTFLTWHVIDGAYCTFKSKANNRNSVLNFVQIKSLENLGGFFVPPNNIFEKKCLYFRYANASGSSESLVRNIWVFSPLVPSKRENLALLSLYTFWGKCVYFSIFEW